MGNLTVTVSSNDSQMLSNDSQIVSNDSQKNRKMGVPCMEMIAIQCPLALGCGFVFICAIVSM